jgi:predicted enzyme related to lactoylglutathione lyase
MAKGSDGGVPGGVGSNPMAQTYATFYVEVDDVQAALDKVESLGGTKVVGPMEVPNGPTIGMFNDPDGNLVGVFKGM